MARRKSIIMIRGKGMALPHVPFGIGNGEFSPVDTEGIIAVFQRHVVGKPVAEIQPLFSRPPFYHLLM